jgi:hypothetical protein
MIDQRVLGGSGVGNIQVGIFRASAVPSRVVEGFLFCDGRPFSAFCASLHLSNHENP